MVLGGWNSTQDYTLVTKWKEVFAVPSYLVWNRKWNTEFFSEFSHQEELYRSLDQIQEGGEPSLVSIDNFLISINILSYEFTSIFITPHEQAA